MFRVCVLIQKLHQLGALGTHRSVAGCELITTIFRFGFSENFAAGSAIAAASFCGAQHRLVMVARQKANGPCKTGAVRYNMVRRAGLEPARCYPLAPQASASANSATSANSGLTSFDPASSLPAAAAAVPKAASKQPFRMSDPATRSSAASRHRLRAPSEAVPNRGPSASEPSSDP